MISENVKNLVTNQTILDSSLIPLTVRVTPSQRDFIDQVGEDYGRSRQEILSVFVQDGIHALEQIEAEKAKDESNFPVQYITPGESKNTVTTSYYLLNTNKRNDPRSTSLMISKGIAAAFYSPWKEGIEKIRDGDYVFLFENKKGIIAYGIATGKYKSMDYDGNKDVCNYIQLNCFKVLKKPLTAEKIRKTLGYNMVFSRTLFPITSNQENLLKELGEKES